MSKLQALIQSYQGKSVTVIGMGVSNTPLIQKLLDAKIPVTVRDKNPDPQQKEAFLTQGATFFTGTDYLEGLSGDVIFRTPGVSPNTPQLLEAKKQGSAITSEMAEFFHLCPCPIIAVTGSDGKTTTTTLIGKFLEAAGKTVHLGGNIGRPLLCEVEQIQPHHYVVLELSSFQLMDMTKSPDVAVITNLSPNHLDYHHTIQEYITAKTNIFTHQSPENRVIFNLDNQTSVDLAPQVPSKLCYFGRETATGDAYIQDGTLWIRSEAGPQPVLPLQKILLKGVHNVENYMAAALAVAGICPPEAICQVAETFTGVAHRMQPVRTLDGVTYYNDSIGTTPTRTLAGLRAFDQRIILLAGGYDKGIPFQDFGVEIHHYVKHLVLAGTTAEAIAQAVEQGRAQADATLSLPGTLESVTICQNLEEAVHTARKLATSGDDIVLSPACAAFDQFKNFVERGIFFQNLVESF